MLLFTSLSRATGHLNCSSHSNDSSSVVVLKSCSFVLWSGLITTELDICVYLGHDSLNIPPSINYDATIITCVDCCRQAVQTQPTISSCGSWATSPNCGSSPHLSKQPIPSPVSLDGKARGTWTASLVIVCHRRLSTKLLRPAKISAQMPESFGHGERDQRSTAPRI
jgi:hypothetical protein